MDRLLKMRQRVDEIDTQLAALVEERLRLADAIAEVKRKDGRSVSDPIREREILTRVSGLVGKDYARNVRTVYTSLFGVSKARQRVLVGETSPIMRDIAAALEGSQQGLPDMAYVACCGAEGAYAQQAASRMFAVPTILYFNDFDNVFEAVEKGFCAYGVLPVENSSAGSVSAVYDLMQRHRFHIVRGVKLKVDHVLLANSGVALGDIAKVTSHPQALAQCSGFLKRHPKIRAATAANTAVAARALAEAHARDEAVIASRACAELYGLRILDETVADSTYNYTRFICIARSLAIYEKANKFALMLSLPHRPGALSEVIAKFSDIGVNLTKLESRPVLGSAFEFRFVFEFEAEPKNPDVLALLAELSVDPQIEHFAFLGAYEES